MAIVTITNASAVPVFGVIGTDPGTPLLPNSFQLTATASGHIVYTSYWANGQGVLNWVWTSSDPGVASVDMTGHVSTTKAGTAVISAAVQDNLSATASVTVTVKDGGAANLEVR